MQELSPVYELAREFAVSTNRNIFLTGKAGTGKTTFLRQLQNLTKKQMAVVAPTGVAAINAGGTTIHSFFQLPFTPFLPTADGRKDLIDKIKMQGYRRKVIQELELLVIDEVSMVRADVLDAIDTVLRHFRFNYKEPFGGVQLLFIGDMFQLSPVALEDEWRILAPYYKSPYFFHSQVVGQQPPVYIELDKIFRQTNEDFIQVLNEVRNNCLSAASLNLIQKRYNPFFEPPVNDTFITLTTHNYKADKINADELNKIEGKSVKFKAIISGEFPEKSYPTDEYLELKKGCKVMFIKNDTESPRHFFNGKIGVVLDFDDDTILIECPDDNEPIELNRMVWENIRYTTNDKTRQIEEDTLGKFIQFPLRLAWAITIHKSQGLTFDKAIIDAGDAFTSGQVYVALSRCRSLDGMILLSKLNPYSIENDRLIVEHQLGKLPQNELEHQLDASKNEFRFFVLKQLFDFNVLIGLISRLLRTVDDVSSSFNEDTPGFVKDILKQAQIIQEVAVRFQNQLEKIVADKTDKSEYLSERIQAATVFFTEKLKSLSETIKQSPVQTDSRDNAREFNEQIRNVFAVVSQKQHIMNGLKGIFYVEDFFVLRNSFILPELNINAYAKVGEKNKASENPKLFYQLIALRNKICEPNDMPIYLVAGNRTLLEISDFLPVTEADLMKIYGFGPGKVEKYGEQFLSVVRKFCDENQLVSQMNKLQGEKKEKKQAKEKKEKKEKVDSHRLSFELFQSGKSVDEIATERGLTIGTICSHLSKYITLGQLNIDQFISEDKRQKALQIIEDNKDSESVYQLLSEVLRPHELNFFFSWRRTQHN